MTKEMCADVYYTGVTNCSQIVGDKCGIDTNFESFPWEREHPCFNATIPGVKADKWFSWRVSQMEVQ
jgi:hypothetical protein